MQPTRILRVLQISDRRLKTSKFWGISLLFGHYVPSAQSWRLRAKVPEDQNLWTMQKIENHDNWPERHLYRVISSHDIAGVKMTLGLKNFVGENHSP